MLLCAVLFWEGWQGMKQPILTVSMAVLVGGFCWAGTLSDPSMGVKVGSLSDPFLEGRLIVPVDGGGVFGFYNPFSTFLTSLKFDLTIKTGLNPVDVSEAFVCNDANTPGGNANPFFLNCGVAYNPDSGFLVIRFFGVNPPDQDPPDHTEAGEQEGIPPLIPGCGPTPDGPGCNVVGHFIITLNDDFAIQGPPSGGWSVAKSPDLFAADPVIRIGGVPEPSSGAQLLAGLAGLGFLAWRSVRSWVCR
jgi:hypothetical protein